MPKLLLVEDNQHKRDRILAYLREVGPEWEVTEAHSFNAACKHIQDAFDLLILDISLPTYDKSPVESGGRFRTFGGREIARKVLRRGPRTKVLFVTQYEAFSDKGNSQTLESLGEALANDCGPSYMGVVHYDSSQSAWKDRISEALRTTKP